MAHALLVAACLVALLCLPSTAGTLDKAGLAGFFPAPLVVGDKDPDLAIWPILKQEAGSFEVFAYAFESKDFAPIPGFGGSPPDLLIAMAPDGTFRDVKVLSQHEPVFVDGYGTEPLFAFVQQYVGLSAKHSIRVGRANARARGANNATVVDGIAMATASTRVINEEILESALAVARKKLGFGAATNLGLKVVAKDDAFTALSWDALLAKGWVEDFRLTNRTVDAAFADTAVADQSDGKPDAAFADTYIAYLNVPTIGRNLLGDTLYAYVMASLAPGDHAIMVLAHGPWDPIGDDYTFGAHSRAHRRVAGQAVDPGARHGDRAWRPGHEGHALGPMDHPQDRRRSGVRSVEALGRVSQAHARARPDPRREGLARICRHLFSAS